MKVNGKEVQFEDNLNILNLLEKYNLNKEKVVVEVNLNILEVEDYEAYIIKRDDSIELISFVGGG